MDTTLIALADRAHPVAYGLVLLVLAVRPLLSRLMTHTEPPLPFWEALPDTNLCPELVRRLSVAMAALQADVTSAGPRALPAPIHGRLIEVQALVEMLQEAHDALAGPDTAHAPDADADTETAAP